jgi:diaminopimelate decarboxylase
VIGFNFKNNRWYADNVPLEKIARSVGTPSYVYSLSHFEERFREMDKAYAGVPHLVAYSIKTNDNLSVLAHLARLGSGADVVSGGELYKARRAGIPASRIVFAGVGKREDEMSYALREGIRFFNVESIPEIEVLDKAAGRLGKTAVMAVRFNPDVDARTHRHITTGKKGTKFGVPLDQWDLLTAAVRRCRNVRWTGVHAHIGSQMTQTASVARAVRVLERLVRLLRREGFPIQTVNLGGGYGIRYRDEKAPPAAAYARVVKPVIRRLNAELIVEPGRFLSGNSGVLLAKVLYVKRSGGKTFLVTDTAMTELIRPCLYEAYHAIEPVTGSRKASLTADVVGPVCESTDFLAKGRKLPAVRQGDVLAVFSAGAYGSVMGSNYNSRPFPPEVVVRGGKFRVARRRQTVRDLVSRQSIVRL